MGFPSGSVVKNPPANAGDAGLIPGSERSPEGGNGNPPQYSCLGNSMDRGTWQAPFMGLQSQTQLKAPSPPYLHLSRQVAGGALSPI